MDLEIEKYVRKQIQLQEQIKELFAEKKMLQNQICVLNECLSLEKVNRKISELENKQKILTSLESMVNNLRTDIKPLEYLKQVLQRQLMVSTLPTNDLNMEEQKYSESSLSTSNSLCAIETMDSSSDVSSEDSIMILSDYDVVSDEELFNNTEKSVENKVMYEEALLMASSVHLSLVEHLISNNDSIEPFINNSDQVKDNNCHVQSNSKNTVSLMNTSNKSEQLLELCDVVSKLNLLNCNENENIEMKCNERKTKPIVYKADQPYIYDKELCDTGIKSLDNKECDNVSKLVNDSWVKINTNEISNEKLVDIFQSVTDSQKDNKVSKVNVDVDICENNIDEIKSFDNSNNVDFNDENEIQKQDCLVKDKIDVNSLLFNEDSNVLKQLNLPKENLNVEIQEQNDHLCNHQFESKGIIEIKNIENVCNDIDIKSESIVQQYENKIMSSSLSSTNDSNISNKFIELKVNTEKESQVYIHQFESINSSKIKSCLTKNIYNENENNPVCPYDEVKITTSLPNTECSNVPNKSNNLFTNINDKVSSINNNEKPILICRTINLKDELLNGIHQYGIQDLTSLQQQCMSHCINGCDVIFHSYPCVGKSTVCLISVLQRINTSLNECQAIILVPTLELALSAQKTMKSIGKFLNVSTCIGGTNVPRKLSPVPHVVISTLQGLCEMINCNSLCKDFIKMLVIDDAEDMLKCNGFFNKIRYVLLFLNNNCQLIIMSTSKIEEILDQFSDLMQNPEYILAPNEKPSLNDILQYCVYVPEEWKFDAFCELYEVLDLIHTVVYCNTWSKSLEIAEAMRLKTYLVSAVYNKMDIYQRNLVLHQFQSGINRVLITSELQRGEDFSDISWVINYDLPKSSKDYVRKIIGCFNRRVKVINFITTNDKTAKEVIETDFNVSMLNLSQDLTDLCVSNL
ncbi:protein PFC0760c-like [Rhopalosiphum maidis]|uniref:protein PFC0760c-like n=1 Tax=Rhopalosiphum maidis TaxID=43146 RepID=UPI000EFE2DA5|nr:protein PFC0760c-like [Rhopalosiphum maidis]